LYSTRKREASDAAGKRQIEAVLLEQPDYGHTRIAIQRKLGHHRVRRVMKKYGLKPYRRRAQKLIKPQDQGKRPAPYPNLLAPLVERQLIIRPNQVWGTACT
jgi:hypothetical protein